jgi:predicted ATPase/DNA-binding SARP family transcriptional activator
MRFRVLGPLQVRRSDGECVDLPEVTQRALLTRLIIAEGTALSSTDLGTAVSEAASAWPTEAELAAQLHVLAARLDATGAEIQAVDAGHFLRLDRRELDAARFSDRVAAAGGFQDPPERIAVLEQALVLWRGPAYGEFAAGFAADAAQRLDEERAGAVETLAQARLEIGDLSRAIDDLERLVAEHPLRERAHELLMHALSGSGLRAEALATYARLRDRLRDATGKEPSLELTRLQRALLDQAVGSPAVPAVPGHSLEPPLGFEPALPPEPLTSFVGRDDELASVDAQLASTRVLTLHGPGGVGKTRMALHVAHHYRSRTDVRVGWVELAPIGDPNAALYATAEALGVRELDAVDPVGSLVRALGEQPTLVVLDNCEHVIDVAAHLAEGLAQRAESVTVLATSREPLGLGGEVLVPVAPLDTADVESPSESPAVQLLADRLASARGRTLGADELPHAAELVRRLDGLPLALELAAGRAAALGLPELSRRAGIELLDRGSRTGDVRHRSLRSMVGWSYQLLDDAEQRLFARLSVFAGAFSIARAEVVCSDERVPARRVAGLLADLVDRSLVVGARDVADGRYRLLVTLRDFAVEQLQTSGEAERWQGAHAEHLSDVAAARSAALQGPAEADAVEHLVGDIEDLRAAHTSARRHADAGIALRLSDALHDFASRQIRPELFEWAERAVDMTGADKDPLYPAVLGSAAKGAWLRGDLAGAVRRAEAALTACPAPADPRRLRSLLSLAEVALVSGRLADAIVRYRQAAALAESCDAVGALVDAEGGLAMTLADSGNLVEGLDHAARCAERAEVTGAPSLAAWACYAEARCRAHDQPDAAAGLLEEAGRLAAGVGNRSTEFSALTRLLALRSSSGDPKALLRAYRETLDRWRRSGSTTFLWVTLRNLAEPLRRAGRLDTSAALERAAKAALAGVQPDPSALDTALRLGLGAIDELTAAPVETPVPIPGPRQPEDATVGHDGGFRRTGAMWALRFGGQTAHLPDRKGLHDIATLLGRPAQEVHCLDLLVDAPIPAFMPVDPAGLTQPGDLGELIDAPARKAYQARITDLQHELDEADAAADAGRGERAQRELDFLVGELAAAYGLGGRPRRAGDPVEKARTTVTWRIRHAIAKIADAHPLLGQHLQRSVHTGRYCVYRPDEPVRWQL